MFTHSHHQADRTVLVESQAKRPRTGKSQSNLPDDTKKHIRSNYVTGNPFIFHLPKLPERQTKLPRADKSQSKLPRAGESQSKLPRTGESQAKRPRTGKSQSNLPDAPAGPWEHLWNDYMFKLK